ncbi:hypothetical protein ACJMK2_026876 [Sinanodonta woodiana]|uniref:Uncharacterized protein n=1 Tax=Sinanodonta woodiana TaxID=1069815 RepID=A0ABD3XL47_SINWO
MLKRTIVCCLVHVISVLSATDQCVYNGKTYNDGDSFKVSDPCSNCFCIWSQMICTECPIQRLTSVSRRSKWPQTSPTDTTLTPSTRSLTTTSVIIDTTSNNVESASHSTNKVLVVILCMYQITHRRLTDD